MAALYLGQPYKDSNYVGGSQVIPGKLMCAYYDLGGEGVAYHDTTDINQGSGRLNPPDGTYLNEFRMDESVDTSYTKFRDDIDNSIYNFVEPEKDMLYVGWTEPSEWMKYSINVKESGTYFVNIMYTSNRGGAISISVDDNDVTGPVSIEATFHPDDKTDWRQWHHWNKMNKITKINLDKGFHVLTLHTVETGHMNYAYLEFELEG